MFKFWPNNIICGNDFIIFSRHKINYVNYHESHQKLNAWKAGALVALRMERFHFDIFSILLFLLLKCENSIIYYNIL